MDFSVSREMQDLLARVRAFVDAELIPLEPTLLADHDMAETTRLADAKRAQVKALGLWAPGLPKDIGGLGLGLVDLGLVSEELGRCPLGHYVFGAQAPDMGNAELLHMFGSQEQQQTWLQPLAQGDIRSCFAMTERHTAGANPTQLAATAVRDGDNYVLNAHKWFTSSADGSAFTIFMGVTNPEAPPHGRASMIIAPMHTPGIKLVRNIPVMGHAGGGWFSHAEVLFENVRVPVSNRLGPEGAGFMLAQARLGPGRIHHCMRWLGICQRALEELCKRANSREIAPGKPLASKQIVQAWIAESAAEVQAARAFVLQTAWHIERDGFKGAKEHVSMIKYYVAGIMQQVLDRAIQAHGALGVTDDTVLAFLWRQERAARIYDGPDEVHKMSVAKKLLKQHA